MTRTTAGLAGEGLKHGHNTSHSLIGRDLLIDVTRLADHLLRGKHPTGVDRVSLAYLDHYRADALAVVRYGGRWIELPRRDSQRVFDALLGRDQHAGRTVRWCVGKGYALSWQRCHGGFLFNTGHSGLNQPEYARAVERCGLRPLFFLHDLIPITHPEYCRPGEADRHRLRLDTMLRVGEGLILNSDVTCDDLHHYADAIGRAVPPYVVAPLAPARLPAPALQPPLNRPYFVVLSTIEPRKNHLLLLHLWRQLIDEVGDAAPMLVIIGQRGWECEQVVDLLDRCTAFNGHVVERARCDDRELATWLHHARALLFPSFVEGFGIPLIEALLHGVPVIASDLVVFHEIAGQIPEYLDPLDGIGWRRAVLDYAEADSPRRHAQLARLAGYRAPTWADHFARVDAFIESLMAGA
jgi:glycosyltransferase involved in cell wall biosynthesis